MTDHAGFGLDVEDEAGGEEIVDHGLGVNCYRAVPDNEFCSEVAGRTHRGICQYLSAYLQIRDTHFVTSLKVDRTNLER